MSKKISGAEHPLAEIFSSSFEYLIPHYQRPYAWTVDEASELFDDLYDFYKTEKEEDYFLGSIVLIKEESEPKSEVIDGQQRLTTLTILLSALTSNLSGELHTDFRDYIREPGKGSLGLKSKPRLELREKDRKFFADHVQDFKFDKLLALDKKELSNESQINIQLNSKLLLRKLAEKFGDDQEAIFTFGSFLVQRCFLVVVSTHNQQSAFRVFSVMNSRGLDLQPTDIIKANILGKLQNEEAERYNERWEDMEVELGRDGFNDLFTYVRMIYAKEKVKRALLEEFEHHVLKVVTSPYVLVEEILEPFADALATVKQVSYEATSHSAEVNGYLRWLRRIDNSDWIPSAILFLSRQKSHPEYVAWFFQRLERLAAFMHVCAYNVNERLERYSQLLTALESEHSADRPVKKVELLEEEKEKMAKALNGDIYSLTARRRNYIILRLDSFMSDGAAIYDPSILTIEHVLPQTVEADSEWEQWWPDQELRQQWVHRIANLVPLNQRRNSKAGNFNFKRKKEAYFAGKGGVSSYVLTTQVLNASDDCWKQAFLAERQEELMSVFADRWRLE